MQEIFGAIGNLTGIICGITAASTEQSSGIQQVNMAIGQLDDVTQQNAALVEQAAASSESLEEQAAHLSANVAKFKIDENPGSAKGAHQTVCLQKPVQA